jgi:sigma-B regulation protein RsbU (phosphoserine phosphatase)
LARVETHLALRLLQEQLESANRKMIRELDLAGQVQNSFFPQELPDIPGWQLSIRIQPARETSGDFYDVIPLPESQYGILMADVVDKGVAAALYMALSWSLIRTYASDYPSQPEKVLSSVNQRILEDTNAKQFVTVFYTVFNPADGQFLYANAGHSPPLVINSHSGEVVRKLEFTGKPLGLFVNESCERSRIELAQDELLVFYTDGVTEAQNRQGSFFEEQGLVKSLTQHLGVSARDLVDAVLKDIERYGAEAQFADDIALGVLYRE